jgi:hypothetical protein
LPRTDFTDAFFQDEAWNQADPFFDKRQKPAVQLMDMKFSMFASKFGLFEYFFSIFDEW